MTFKVVIPARHASTRLPGKPLVDLAGRPLVQHVYERACASGASEVLIATDDERIMAACRRFAADVQMTRSDHPSGTDRIAEVIKVRGWSDDTLVVNLQGDEPVMPPTLIDQVAANLAAYDELGAATLADPICDRRVLFDPHVVKVVIDSEGMALYFSRAPIPWHRDEFLEGESGLPDNGLFLRHIGLYAYRAEFVTRFVAWPPAPLELAESLEQLRALWHGERLHVDLAAVSPGPPGVDTHADLGRVAAWLATHHRVAGSA